MHPFIVRTKILFRMLCVSSVVQATKQRKHKILIFILVFELKILNFTISSKDPLLPLPRLSTLKDKQL